MNFQYSKNDGAIFGRKLTLFPVTMSGVVFFRQPEIHISKWSGVANSANTELRIPPDLHIKTHHAVVIRTIVYTILCPNPFDAHPKWILNWRKEISHIEYGLKIHELSKRSNVEIPV